MITCRIAQGTSSNVGTLVGAGVPTGAGGNVGSHVI